MFGKPAASCVASEAERLGAKRVFLVVSRTLNTKTDEVSKVVTALGERFAGLYDGIPQHTARKNVAEATRAAMEVKADLLVAIGGGSVVDAVKIMQICIEYGIVDDCLVGLDPFEVKPGPGGKPVRPEFRGPRVRMLVVPTTLSGGEFNAGCLVTDTERKLKQTFMHPEMMAITIILDPAITRHTPEQLWIGSGTRAMDHAIEALCSRVGSPLVDAVVLRGIELMAATLPRSKADPDDLELRRECQIASWLCSSGLQARVPMGASHAIGHVLGGTCDVPHYLCTPVMMPSILKFNKPASEEAQRLLAKALGRRDLEAADAFKAFAQGLGLPTSLKDVGVTAESFPIIAKNTMTEFFIFSNPRPAGTPELVTEILEMAAA
jgi:alcohol dehydrogenase class IV